MVTHPMKILHSLTLLLNTKLIKCLFKKKHMDFETKQKAGMNKINKCLNVEKSELATLSKILLKRKKIQIKKPIKMLEKERESLSNK